MPATTPETQRDHFAKAVDMIGGQAAAAAALRINPRSVRRLLTGELALHAGLLADMGKALLAHAEACRAMERQLSPAFAANLTDTQRDKPPHAGTLRFRQGN